MFITTLFTVAKSQAQPECALTNEWIEKTWQIHTMEYYSAVKKNNNKIMPFAAIQTQLNIIIPSEVSRKEKDKYQMISLICSLKYGTDEPIYKTESSLTDTGIGFVVWDKGQICPRDREGERRMKWELWGLADASYHLEWINSKVLLYTCCCR